jgi:hypothetical protein
VNGSYTSGRFRRVLLGLLAAVCVLSFAAVVVAADRGRLPAGIRRLYQWPGGDKVGHVVLLATVTFAVALALRGRRVRLGRWSLPLASVAVGIGITLEEASQAWFPGRTLSVADLGCSYLGIFVGTWAAAALRARVAATRGAAPRAT